MPEYAALLHHNRDDDEDAAPPPAEDVSAMFLKMERMGIGKVH